MYPVVKSVLTPPAPCWSQARKHTRAWGHGDFSRSKTLARMGWAEGDEGIMRVGEGSPFVLGTGISGVMSSRGCQMVTKGENVVPGG